MYNTSILSHVPSLQLKCFLAHCITAAVVADCIAACCDRRNESKRKKSEKKTHSFCHLPLLCSGHLPSEITLLSLHPLDMVASQTLEIMRAVPFLPGFRGFCIKKKRAKLIILITKP